MIHDELRLLAIADGLRAPGKLQPARGFPLRNFRVHRRPSVSFSVELIALVHGRSEGERIDVTVQKVLCGLHVLRGDVRAGVVMRHVAAAAAHHVVRGRRTGHVVLICVLVFERTVIDRVLIDHLRRRAVVAARRAVAIAVGGQVVGQVVGHQVQLTGRTVRARTAGARVVQMTQLIAVHVHHVAVRNQVVQIARQTGVQVHS